MLLYRDVHGYRRAYRVEGDGAPLLLLHGVADSSLTWEQVVPTLAERHTVIAPDLLGHGDSARPRADYAIAAYACGVRDLLTVLGVERVSVVGHSLGGGVAMQFAYQFPERCERVVLVSSAGLGPQVHPMLRLAAGPGAFPGMRLFTSAPVQWLAPALLRWTGGAGLGPDLPYVLRRYRQFADADARHAFLRTIRAAVDLRGQHITMLDRGYLARRLPTMVVWGARDGIIPLSHAHAAVQALPGSRLEVFEEAGHFPHHQDPDRFAKVVLDFLDTTAPAVYDRAEWRADLCAGPRPSEAEASSGS
ncbi:alpha/beta fold hydrolase [Streptomyces polyrhachis]|uniref:Alpha/beta fold hydrolase n=1 Tax=Streptomyces polyrhachis TaxID=1282885 RepID=A0ABW2GIN9_9ACTN